MKSLISCDWGTSSFRLRLVDAGTGTVIKESRSPDGAATIFNKWSEANAKTPEPRQQFYLRWLRPRIDELIRDVTTDRPTIVISGMATSSVGIAELPYATLPFAVDGSNAVIRTIASSADFPYDLLLISGVRSDNDVMRGEETQLAGLSAAHQKLYSGGCICVMPGTHSKHVHIEAGRIINFQTYITGELFNVMTHYSLLKNSVEKTSADEAPELSDAFRSGVSRSGDAVLLNTLFTVRTNHLLGTLGKPENYYYLSGLLIGSELNALKGRHHGLPIQLCGGEDISELYQTALQELGMSDRAVIIDAAEMDAAAIAGHLSIVKRFNM